MASTQAPHLLTLPREIRDLIFDILFVRSTIGIECALTEDVHYAEDVPLRSMDWPSMYPLRYPLVHRSTWPAPASDLQGIEEWWTLSNHAQPLDMTYQLALGDDIASAPIPIQATLVCKQMYHEARKTFYAKNVFRLVGDFQIPTALQFLKDRSPGSRLLISALEMSMMEDECVVSEQTDAYIPSSGQDHDTLRLRYAYSYYEPLCSLLASSMKLRYLGLSIDSGHAGWHFGNHYWAGTVEKIVQFDRLRDVNMPSWLDPLLSIRDLDNVRVSWNARWPCLRTYARVTKEMASIMLKGPGNGRRELGSSDAYSVESLLRLHYDEDYSVECPHGRDFKLHYNLQSGEATWKPCHIKVHGLQLVEVPADAGEVGSTGPGRRSIIDSYGAGVICHYNLNRA